MFQSIELLVAAKWYVVMLLVGIPGWLLIARRSKDLPDGGYGLGKVVGLLGLSALTWALCIAKLLPFTMPSLWILTAFMWGAVYYRRSDILPILKKHWRQIIIIEIVCLVLFSIGVGLRVNKPAIEGIEKFMDSGLLNSVMRTEKGAPLDQWHGGKVVNYYYFGHWIVGLIAKQSNTPGWYAFNLGFAMTVSVAGSMLVLAGWTLTRKLRGGLLVVFLALFASNIHPFLAFLKGNTSYFFFSSGRFVDVRINEYPFYSLTLGDLHAHMLSLMLTTCLAIFAILHMLIEDTKLKSNAVWMGALLGLMAATNAFDTLSCSILVGLVLLARWYRDKQKSPAALFHAGLYCAAAAALPIGIFLTHFKQPTGGLGIKLFEIPLIHIVWQFGVPLGLVTASFAVLVLTKTVKLKKSLFASVRSLDARHLLIGIFTIFALALIIIPEIGFVKDLYFYVNPSYSLANTEFKVWYTGWMALAIVTGSAVTIAIAALWKQKRLASYVAIVLVAGSLSVLCVGIKRGLETLNDTQPNSLNGVIYMNDSEPDRVKVVEWAASQIDNQPIVLEAVGDSYSNYNWFSSYTGLPTIMGWRSHQFGWRYNKDAWTYIVGRENVVKEIYGSKKADLLTGIVKSENVSYIMIGPQERALYNTQDSVFAQAFGKPVFHTTTIDVYYTGVDQK